MTPKQKNWIDKATYIQLLERWRFGSAGDPMFQGDTGDYYRKVLQAKRKEVGQAAHLEISKLIGWGK